MPRVFITGSTDGLGRAAARALIESGKFEYQRRRLAQAITDEVINVLEGIHVNESRI
jgi:NAD(P)-dependent dehydrogenase (short-subunit alcohol dehydrogenase family)